MTQRSFRDAYGTLQQHAQTLRDQAEPNIDDLLTIVTESVAAYKVCKERIDAVEAALKVALDGAGVGGSTQPTGPAASDRESDAPAARPPASRPASAPSKASSELDDMDDDIPF